MDSVVSEFVVALSADSGGQLLCRSSGGMVDWPATLSTTTVEVGRLAAGGDSGLLGPCWPAAAGTLTHRLTEKKERGEVTESQTFFVDSNGIH
jgi:hypothetical protein